MARDGSSERGGDELCRLAWLYARGELAPDDAAAFERRLADDQAAREALALAVREGERICGRPAPRPPAVFRRRVRDRLRLGAVTPATPGAGGGLARRSIPWAVGGALAAGGLLVAFLNHPFGPMLSNKAKPPDSAMAMAAGSPDENDVGLNHEFCPSECMAPERGPLAESPGRVARQAEVWAELHSPDRLWKNREDEARRKQRHEQLYRHGGRDASAGRGQVEPPFEHR